ncbi:MAG: SDR family NAD(P)-dependent oxidoreductase [Nostocoides sp.]
MSRHVLITGAASGLGLALAKAFVARGDLVLATDRDAGVEPGVLPNGVEYQRLDVTSDADWAAAKAWVEARWGRLDVLVNNAGIATGGRIDVSTIEDWERGLAINLLGVVRGCYTFTPMFKAQRSGYIVNTASLAGLVHGPAMSAYNANKAAVVALSETLRYELAPFGITTSVVCPSFFRTNLAASMHGADAAAEKTAAKLIDESPLTAEDIAVAVMAGIDRQEPVILPDELARQTYWTKTFDRPLYDRQFAEAGERAAYRELHPDGRGQRP